jgi:hypothetical protein
MPTPDTDVARNLLHGKLLETQEFQLIQGAVQRLWDSITVLRDGRKPWGVGNRAPSHGLIVIGEFRAGKSFGTQAALRQLCAKAIGAGKEVAPNMVSVDAPSPFTQEGLDRQLLGAMNLMPSRPLGATQTRERLQRRLALFQPTLIRIDEFQRTLSPVQVSARRLSIERERIWGAIRSLMDDPNWPVPLVLSGTPEVLPLLERHEMGFLKEKCEIVELPRMKPGNQQDLNDLEDALQIYASAVGLRPVEPMDFDLCARLMLAANYAKGLAFELTQRAVLNALERNQSSLDPENFATVYARKTGAHPPANPFIASDWHRVDPTRLLASDNRPYADGGRP